MLIRNFEKLPKRTLRERICEEVVRLILSGELPSGGWLDEKQVIHKLRVSRTPFREAIGVLAKSGLVEIKPYRGFYVRSFSRNETADIYELFKRLECFAIELAIPLMSDRDISGLENILIEGVAALQRGDMKTYAMRDREFYKSIAEQSRNSALIEALTRVGLQIQLCGTITEAASKKGSPRKRSTVQVLGPDRWSAGLPSMPRRSSLHRAARWLEAALRSARG